MKAEDLAHHGSNLPQVRLASLDDSEYILRLSHQLGYSSSIRQIKSQLIQILGREDHAILVLVRSGDRVVGWVHIYERPLVYQQGGAEIGGLIVDEAERGRGFGMLLLLAAEDWARNHDLNFIMLRSNTKRLKAKGFYTSAGYELVKTSNTFRKPLVDSS